jgi:ribosomal protein L7/L12
MNRHTTIVCMYIDNKATIDELEFLRAKIDFKLATSGRFKTNFKFTQELDDNLLVGNVLHVVKIVKELTGLGLKEAKELCEERRHFLITTNIKGVC